MYPCDGLHLCCAVLDVAQGKLLALENILDRRFPLRHYFDASVVSLQRHAAVPMQYPDHPQNPIGLAMCAQFFSVQDHGSAI